MAPESPLENPFQPGRGVPPPVLAGRDAELAAAEQFLDSLEGRKPPAQDILFYGPRGNGKTALLLRVAERARTRGLRVEALSLQTCASEANLVRRLQEVAPGAGDRLTGVSAGGFGFTAERAAPIHDVTELFLRWVGGDRGAPPLVIVLDEVHAVSPEAGRALFDAVQAAKGKPLPLLLLAAGTPDAPRRLRRMGTHNERAFRRFRIGRLRREDTRTALAEPARASGLPMTGSALALLSEESQDYPYFIQMLGRAAWDAARRAGIHEIQTEAARGGAAAARPEINDFYGDRFLEAIEHRVHRALHPIAALAQRKGRRLGFSEIESLLEQIVAAGGFSGDWASLLLVLEDLGVLWETAPGVWEMGIPSFAEHVIRRHEAEKRSA